jgi:pimeloyl-ACP methyl ester carboxylesterase
LKKVIKSLLKKLLFSRSGQYTPVPELEKGWNKTWIESSQKKICILSRINPSFSGPMVILAHPYVKDAKLFFLKNGHAEEYLKMNADVIIPDFNGFGESPFVNFRFEEDLALVAEHFSSLYPDRKIMVHGISFGASQTINYAASSRNMVQKIIIENCLDSNLSYYKKRNKKIYLLTRLLMILYPSGNKNHNYVKNISRLNNVKKVLFIYNSEDDLTTPDMGKDLEVACNTHSEMTIFPGIHLKAYKESPDRYKDTVRTFLWD